MKDTVIEVKNIKKGFKIYSDKGNTLKERLIFFKTRNAYTKHEVLKEVSLNIKKGEVIGLIGHNGCGKSTLLKLMTRIIYPDSGSIKVLGKVSSLIELGAGFHPDMTGRENIYINASIYGLTKKEIDAKVDEIISFSELGDFIDSPVRTYSSGMYMRLAFSVAINVEAEILLIDEILSVGDANFQAKCFNKMQELKSSNLTIVIVSHDLTSIERLCNRAIWIENGMIKEEGRPHDIVAKYLDNIMNKDKAGRNSSDEVERKKIELENNNRTGNKDVEIIDVKLFDKNNEEKYIFDLEESLLIRIKYKRNNTYIKDSVVGIGIERIDGINCYGTNTLIDNFQKIELNDSGEIDIFLEKLQLIESEYYIDLAFHDEYGKPYDYIRKVKKIRTYSKTKDVGIFRIKHEITHL